MRSGGYRKGYTGLVERAVYEDAVSLRFQDYLTGGTILQSSRCPEFNDPHVRKVAVENMREAA